jgi:hypothetical protein
VHKSNLHFIWINNEETKKKAVTAKRQRSIEREKSRTWRAKESDADAAERRKEDAKRHVLKREHETDEETYERKLSDAERHAVKREQETNEETNERKLKDAERFAVKCEQETNEEGFRRRQLDSDRKLKSRETETESEKRERLDQIIRRKGQRSKSTHNIARKESNVDQQYIGPMNEICSECESINFKDEKPGDGKFSLCCHKGKVKLEPPGPYPELLKALLTDIKHPNYANFIANIRSYNSALAFASMGAFIAPKPGYSPYCFRIHGQIYHRTSPAHPPEGVTPKFAQLYILDSDEALQTRMAIKENTRCDPRLMAELDAVIREISPFAEAFKMMREVEIEKEQRAAKEGRILHPVTMFIRNERKDDERCYNAQRVNKITIVFSSADGEPPLERDIKIYSRSEQKTTPISILNSNCDLMVYPILFPYGEKDGTDK